MAYLNAEPYITYATTSNTATCPVWANWVSNTTAGTTYTPTVVWTQWNTQWVPYNQEYHQRLTPEMLEAMEAERIRLEKVRQRQIQEQEQRQRELRETEERAKACLLSNINDDQAKEFEHTSSFILKTDKRTYRIHLNQLVEELGADGKAIARYCIYTREGVPTYDNMLNKALLLRCNEEEFHKIARRHAA